MPHDKISAAARRRMAETGEPYAAARREVIREHQAAGSGDPPQGPRWFAISYRERGLDRMTAWLDTLLFRSGPGVSGVEIGSAEVRVQMGSFRLDIPRGSVRSVRRSQAQVRGTTGCTAAAGGGW